MPKRLTAEASVQKAVLDLLAAERVFAIRLNTGTVKTADGRYFRAHSGGKGTADILASVRALHGKFAQVPVFLWIETKAPKKGQSLEQLWFQRDVEDQGHFYLVARSSDDVLEWLKYHSVTPDTKKSQAYIR